MMKVNGQILGTELIERMTGKVTFVRSQREDGTIVSSSLAGWRSPIECGGELNTKRIRWRQMCERGEGW